MSKTEDTTDQLSRGEFVHARLRDSIRAGRYPPGTRVRETEVAAWLGVSRTPVREALRRLQADGLEAVVEAGAEKAVAEKAAADSANFTEANRFRLQELATTASVLSQNAEDEDRGEKCVPFSFPSTAIIIMAGLYRQGMNVTVRTCILLPIFQVAQNPPAKCHIASLAQWHHGARIPILDHKRLLRPDLSCKESP